MRNVEVGGNKGGASVTVRLRRVFRGYHRRANRLKTGVYYSFVDTGGKQAV